MISAPKRRRFQYSLATLFAMMTAFGIVCGLFWIHHRVNGRDRMLELFSERGALTGNVVSEESAPKLPFLWAMFGARPIGVIVLADDAFSEEELAVISALFPESSIQRRTYFDMPGTGMGR
jgi:hypothetical protein